MRPSLPNRQQLYSAPPHTHTHNPCTTTNNQPPPFSFFKQCFVVLKLVGRVRVLLCSRGPGQWNPIHPAVRKRAIKDLTKAVLRLSQQSACGRHSLHDSQPPPPRRRLLLFLLLLPRSHSHVCLDQSSSSANSGSSGRRSRKTVTAREL